MIYLILRINQFQNDLDKSVFNLDFHVNQINIYK